MITIENIIELIELDGGISKNMANKDNLGWWFEIPVNDKIKEIEERTKLNYWEYFLLTRYSGLTYLKINNSLRRGNIKEPNEFEKKYTLFLNEILDKLPSENNKICYRWISSSVYPFEAIEFLKNNIGRNIMLPQFFSTSTYKNEAYNYFFEIRTSDNSNGKYIADIVSRKGEQEILFKSHTIFQLLDYDNNTFKIQEVSGKDFEIGLYECFWYNL